MNKRALVKILLFVIALVGVSALLYGVFSLVEHEFDKRADSDLNEDEFSYSEYLGEQIYYESEWYIPKDTIESYLIFGVDHSDDPEREHSNQADFFALLVFDKAQKTYKIIYINRDTITDVPQVDAYGQVYGTVKAQICVAHVYGGEEKVRCRNTINTVEHLLYGVDIDHYISVTMDAVPLLNDSLGGVTVELMDDFTSLDETFVKGAVVTLKGDQALAYVQARSALEDSTNIHRMERQSQYISAVLKKIEEFDSENLADTLMDVSEYVVSDCTVNQISTLLERIETYTSEGSQSLEGESVRGTSYMEFYVDEEALRALVVDTFYELKS